MAKELDKALADALKAVTDLPNTGYNGYAKAYAKAALKDPLTGNPMEGEKLKVQLKYVLSNLQGWKGPNAQINKDILRQYAGIKVDKGVIS